MLTLTCALYMCALVDMYVAQGHLHRGLYACLEVLHNVIDVQREEGAPG